MDGGSPGEGNHRSSGSAKKLIESALLEIAQTGQTHDPYIAAALRARAINLFLGGTFVSPWEVDRLPLEWLDVFEGLAGGLPAMQEGQRQVDAIKAKWLKESGYK